MMEAEAFYSLSLRRDTPSILSYPATQISPGTVVEEGRGLHEGVNTKRLEISVGHLGSCLLSSAFTLIMSV